MNQGRICMSTEGMIVMDARGDALVQTFAAKAATLAAGDPTPTSCKRRPSSRSGGRTRTRARLPLSCRSERLPRCRWKAARRTTQLPIHCLPAPPCALLRALHPDRLRFGIASPCSALLAI
ncbi:MAG: hypothetical protein MI723_08485 [Caulobacterales bacterium]|nr:hypothetical protein [Caulobacterales bacterium]